MLVLFLRLPSCGVPHACFDCLFSHPSPLATWLGPQHVLTHTTVSMGLSCFPSGLGWFPPKMSHQPCLSFPNVESLLAVFLQFLVPEQRFSQNVVVISQEQTDAVLKSHTRQACMAGFAQPRCLSSSSWITCRLCSDISASHWVCTLLPDLLILFYYQQSLSFFHPVRITYFSSYTVELFL